MKAEQAILGMHLVCLKAGDLLEDMCTDSDQLLQICHNEIVNEDTLEHSHASYSSVAASVQQTPPYSYDTRRREMPAEQRGGGQGPQAEPSLMIRSSETVE